MKQESCFQRVMLAAIEDDDLDKFKEFILDGVIPILADMTEEDMELTRSWMGKPN